jgi:hypothetical protein
MSQFFRSKLSRGVKLLTEHAFTPMTTIATALSAADIEPESVRDGDSTFRVNLWFPNIDGRHMYYDKTSPATYDTTTGIGTRQWCVPFVIPPPQELFNPLGTVTATTPTLFLDEVMVSFDQRAEPSALAACNTGKPGHFEHLASQSMNVRVSILEKTMLTMNANVTNFPDSEVFSGLLTAAALTGANKEESAFRINPYAWEGLNKQIHPYKTLVAVIDCEGLRDGFELNTLEYLCLPSFNMSMKFRHKMFRRDVIGDNVQNMPTSHNGAKTTDSIAITTPASDTVIEADAAGGIDNEAAKLDTRLLKRLWAGYTAQGNVSGLDHLKMDAGFEVIAIPMWSNNGSDGIVRAFDVHAVANAGAAPSTGKITDERVIPLPYPIVVHHVIGVWNYCANGNELAAPGDNAGRRPGSATLSAKIGVSLITGMQADTFAATDVAYLNLTVANRATYIIDSIESSEKQTLTDKTQADHQMFDMFQIPMVQDGATTGQGYLGITTGAPLWASKGDSGVEARSNAGSYLNVSQAPPTGGAEQYLMCRWQFEDTVGLSSTGGAPANEQEVYAGIGGNWVFVIGKKCVAGGREPLMSSGR